MKIGPVDPEITGLQESRVCHFAPFRPESFKLSPRKLQSYCTEVRVFTPYSGIITAVNAILQFQNEDAVSQIHVGPKNKLFTKAASLGRQ